MALAVPPPAMNGRSAERVFLVRSSQVIAVVAMVVSLSVYTGLIVLGLGYGH